MRVCKPSHTRDHESIPQAVFIGRCRFRYAIEISCEEETPPNRPLDQLPTGCDPREKRHDDRLSRFWFRVHKNYGRLNTGYEVNMTKSAPRVEWDDGRAGTKRIGAGIHLVESNII